MRGFDGDFVIDETLANSIYDILVEECGAHPNSRNEFVTTVNGTAEYRFIGNLGFGGKFWNANKRFYVNCHREDETPNALAAIEKTNQRLAELLAAIDPPLK